MFVASDLFQMPPVDAEKIHVIAQSVETFQLLTSAAELGFFDALETPKDAESLSQELGLNTTLTRKCCIALTGSGFLKSENGKYTLNDISKTYLLKRSPFYQGDLLALLKMTRIKRWSNLTEALKKGHVGSEMDFNNVFNESFIHAMAQGARRGGLQETLAFIKQLPELYAARNLLDLGGGHGLYAIALTQLNPSLNACVFDLPMVIDSVTRNNISLYGADRVTTIPGDFTKDDLGLDYDIVLTSDVLYRPKEALIPILEKIHASLKDDGLFVSKHWHIDDPVKDITAVYFDLMFSITEGAERLYSTKEFSSLLESSGFSLHKVYNLKNKSHKSCIMIAKKVKNEIITF